MIFQSQISTLLLNSIVSILISSFLILAPFGAVAADQDQQVELKKGKESISKKNRTAKRPKFFLDELGLGEHEIIASAVQSYLTAHGPEAFLDEIHNFLGNQPIARVNADNMELANALGVL